MATRGKAFLLGVFVVSLLAAPAALAETIYQAILLPSAVVPPSGEDAYGAASLIVSDDGATASYTVNFAGVEGAQTSAVLMAAPAGANGPVLVELPLGTPVAGWLTMTPELTAALAAGELAVQIASSDWPAGVLRGAFTYVTVASETATWSSVKALFE